MHIYKISYVVGNRVPLTETGSNTLFLSFPWGSMDGGGGGQVRRNSSRGRKKNHRLDFAIWLFYHMTNIEGETAVAVAPEDVASKCPAMNPLMAG